MLGRQADRDGLEYWVQQINAGNGLEELAKGFIASTEFSEKVNQQGGGDTGFIDTLYENVLGRTPDNEGRVYWLNRMLGETSDDDKAQIALSFTNSEEYTIESLPLVQATKLLTWGVNLENLDPASLGFGSDEAVEQLSLAESVVRLYSGILGRTPDDEGFNYWLETGQQKNALETLAESFLQSDEFLQGENALSTNQVLERLYQQVLQREGDVEGERYWMDRFEQESMSLGELVLAFTESPEFKQASEPLVNDYLEEQQFTGLVGIETDLESYFLG